MYEIRIKKSTKKDLDDKTYIRIDRNIQSLINTPFPKGVERRGESVPDQRRKIPDALRN